MFEMPIVGAGVGVSGNLIANSEVIEKYGHCPALHVKKECYARRFINKVGELILCLILLFQAPLQQ